MGWPFLEIKGFHFLRTRSFSVKDRHRFVRKLFRKETNCHFKGMLMDVVGSTLHIGYDFYDSGHEKIFGYHARNTNANVQFWVGGIGRRPEKFT